MEHQRVTVVRSASSVVAAGHNWLRSVHFAQPVAIELRSGRRCARAGLNNYSVDSEFGRDLERVSECPADHRVLRKKIDRYGLAGSNRVSRPLGGADNAAILEERDLEQGTTLHRANVSDSHNTADIAQPVVLDLQHLHSE